jgi:uncharacterized protein (TIRG00374 family)
LDKPGFLRRVLGSVWFKIAIALLIMGLLIYFNRIDVAVLRGLADTWPWLVGAFLLTIPPFWIVSYRLKVILASQGIDVAKFEALRWTMIGAFFDLAMPSSNGGDIVKAGYIVKHVGAGMRTRAVMAVAIDRVVGLLGLFLLAAVVSIIGWDVLRSLPSRNLILGMSLAAGFGPLLVLRIAGARRLYNNQRINTWLSARPWGLKLKQIIGSFNALRENPKALVTALALSVVNHMFWCSALLCITYAVGESIPPMSGFIVFPLAIFGGVFGVAGGFGVGTAAFDFLLSHLLLVKNGALIGLLFQVMGALTRLLGIPFFLIANRSSDKTKQEPL